MPDSLQPELPRGLAGMANRPAMDAATRRLMAAKANRYERERAGEHLVEPMFSLAVLEVISTNQTGSISSSAPSAFAGPIEQLATGLFDSGFEGWALARLEKPITRFYAVVHSIDEVSALIVAPTSNSSFNLILDWILTDTLDITQINWNNRNDLTYGGVGGTLFNGTASRLGGGSQHNCGFAGEVFIGDLYGGINGLGSIPFEIGATAYGARIRWTTNAVTFQLQHGGPAAFDREKINSLKIFTDIRVPLIDI